MDLPDWFFWTALGLIALHTLGLVPVVRRLRGPDPAVRPRARLDLLETVGTLLLLVGMLLSATVAESWIGLGLAGLALMGVVWAVKGARLLLHALRARCSTP